jgi:hypothetical protein
MFKNVRYPNRYHGFNAQPPYFEGWYYKLVSADERSKFAVIPGIYIAPEPENSHSFIQVFDSEADEVRYHRFPFGDFNPSRDSFEIQIGSNFFSANRVELAIDDALGKLEARLNFNNLSPWPVRIYSPGAMGWFAWAPFMETYHGVVSLDHEIDGFLQIDGKNHDFSGGKGYIEKDWGRKFPSAWIWGQSNHFDEDGVSVMLSTAVIPWLGHAFGGFIIGVLHDGVLYRFATYNRSRIKGVKLEDTQVSINVESPQYSLEIRAQKAKGGLLQAPTFVEMDRRILETLNATIEIQLREHHGKLIYAGVGRHAGLETVGDLEHLIAMID